MKRYNNIYPKVYEYQNLQQAHYNARKGKGFYSEVQMVNTNEKYYLTLLQDILVNKTYKTSKLLRKEKIMRVQGSAYPGRIWIRNKELDYVYITLRDNVEEKQIEHEDTIDTIYEYDEVTIKIVDRPNLEEYITAHFDVLFEMGLQQEATPPLPTEEERLQAVEDAVLILSLGGL